MNATIISIGDELLIGQTVNTNAAWLGAELSAMGVEVVQALTVRDTEPAILEAVEDARKAGQLAIVTGGLGPTRDDLTKETLCMYFDTRLVMNEVVLAKIRSYFEGRGLPVLDVNEHQALLPEDAIILENTRGTASGMWFEKDDFVLISLPGVPYEMKGIMRDHGFPRIAKHFNTEARYHRTVMTTGMGESRVAERIRDWEDGLKEEGMSLAYLPSPGIVKLRVTARGNGNSAMQQGVEQRIGALNEIIPDLIYGYDDESLQQVIGKLLLERSASIATAESCTGGYIAHLITSIPGSSAYYQGSVVSYANEVKQAELSVSEEDLQVYGAVSQQVVEQMATGVLKKMNTDYAIATSGIAGPDGGTDEKPVGTVWVAVASKGEVVSHKFQFGRSRSRTIHVTALAGLNMLRKVLLGEQM